MELNIIETRLWRRISPRLRPGLPHASEDRTQSKPVQTPERGLEAPSGSGLSSTAVGGAHELPPTVLIQNRTEVTVDLLALEYQARIEALITRREGLKEANKLWLSQGSSIVYGIEHFQAIERELEELAYELKEQRKGQV